MQLIVTVGLMFAFIGLANMIWDQNLNHTLPTLFGERGSTSAGVVLTWHRLLTIVLAIALAIGLRILLFRTRLGVVDARRRRQPRARRPRRARVPSWCRASRGRSAARSRRSPGSCSRPTPACPRAGRSRC